MSSSSVTSTSSIQERLVGAAPLRADNDRTSPESSVRDSESAALAELPEIQARMQQMMADHFDGLVSEKIPALDGQTPLEAVHDPDGGEKVMALFLETESNLHRMTPAVDPAILGKVRERLGLTISDYF